MAKRKNKIAIIKLHKYGSLDNVFGIPIPVIFALDNNLSNRDFVEVYRETFIDEKGKEKDSITIVPITNGRKQ